MLSTCSIPSKDWDEAPEEATRDNSQIKNLNGQNQLLSHDEIMKMKESGKTADEIINALTSNSATFHMKTEFSQDKYKRTKSKKFNVLICARRPTAATLCAMVLNKNPAKSCYLRPDALSIALCRGNICAYSRALILENCNGLLVGAVAERMGGYGTICNAFFDKKKLGTELLTSFNLSKNVKDIIHTVAVYALLENCKQLRQDAISMDIDSSQQPYKAPPTNGRIAHLHEFTSCIIIYPSLPPRDVIKTLLPLMAPSSNIVILSPWLQPLSECMDMLRYERLAVNIKLQDCFIREYQVLPHRTHPLVNMNSGGQYILSATVTYSGSRSPVVLPV